MKTAKKLFKKSLDYLREEYKKTTFFKERDIVWTLQKYLIHGSRKKDSKVFNDYAMGSLGELKRTSCDLVIKKNDKFILTAEF